MPGRKRRDPPAGSRQIRKPVPPPTKVEEDRRSAIRRREARRDAERQVADRRSDERGERG